MCLRAEEAATVDDPTVAIVVREWCSLLRLDSADPAQEFFAHGGTSLIAITFAERVEAELGITFPLETLFIDGSLGAVVDGCVERVQQRLTGDSTLR